MIMTIIMVDRNERGDDRPILLEDDDDRPAEIRRDGAMLLLLLDDSDAVLSVIKE